MIMREHELSITKQAKALRISRGSVYYLPRPVSADDLEIMRLLDRLHLDFPFTGVLTDNGIAISMDGKAAWRDNVFVERLWRSVKYEEVYLRAYDSVREARTSIGNYLNFYNGRRPHSSLDGVTPDQAYFNSLPLRLAA